jgi:hypothetical protein
VRIYITICCCKTLAFLLLFLLPMARPLQKLGFRWLRLSSLQQQKRPFSSSSSMELPPPLLSEVPSPVGPRPPAPLPWGLGLFQLMAVPKRKVSFSVPFIASDQEEPDAPRVYVYFTGVHVSLGARGNTLTLAGIL